jgi:nucleoside-diphosphate-sugar epimerase
MKVLLTGCYGYRRGFIANRFYELYHDKYDIDCYGDDIRDGVFGINYDMVIHLAAMAGVRRSHEEPDLYWDVNVKASQRLFKFYEDKCPVIYASSSSIYEWWLSPYASTKWTMECIAPDNALGLRFHTVYGPNSREDMLYDMLQKRNVSYLTDHTRDWTHVDDVCSAIDICIRDFDQLKEHVAIDVGNGRPVSVTDMAEKVWPNNGLPVKTVTGERDNTCADPTILLRHGWEPKHHILEN